MLKHYINVLTIIAIAITFILISGIFLYIHEHSEVLTKNPLYFALGIAFAGGGSSILFELFSRNMLPVELHQEIENIKSNSRAEHHQSSAHH